MRAETFEKALHCWNLEEGKKEDPVYCWCESVEHGRKILSKSTPLEEMRGIAKKAIEKLDLPTCTNFELYWLCCVFCDYCEDYHGGEIFYFDKIVVPGWFPLPFGLRDEKFTSLREKRVYPANVWNESDLKFFPEISEGIEYPLRQLDTDYTIVLSDQHPVRQYVNYGRPIKRPDGGWLRESKRQDVRPQPQKRNLETPREAEHEQVMDAKAVIAALREKGGRI